MRTWSVRGTAFALCTRSSSLSISTRTSIAPESSFGGRRSRDRTTKTSSAGPAVAKPRYSPGFAAVGGDLLDAPPRDEAHGRARHDVDSLDVGREMPVQLVHLKLPLEVRDHPQPFEDRLRIPPARELDDELAEDVDLDIVELAHRVPQEGDAFLNREHRLLVHRTADNTDDDAIEDAGRTRDHIDVTVGHGG